MVHSNLTYYDLKRKRKKVCSRIKHWIPLEIPFCTKNSPFMNNMFVSIMKLGDSMNIAPYPTFDGCGDIGVEVAAGWLVSPVLVGDAGPEVGRFVVPRLE